jgi:hypothetical protein
MSKIGGGRRLLFTKPTPRALENQQDQGAEWSLNVWSRMESPKLDAPSSPKIFYLFKFIQFIIY